MKSIRLLHITDLHFRKKEVKGHEDNSKNENSVDVKDKTIATSYISKINSSWTHEFIESVKLWERRNSKIDAIVCTGDLGSSGNSESIETGVLFLNILCNQLEINKNNLIICPGNHDLDRKKIDNEFESFEKHLTKEGYSNYCSYENIKVIKIKDIPIISINTCLGGSVTSLFVKKYKEIIGKLKDKDKQKFKKELDQLQNDYLEDYLDIPSIGVKQIDELIRTIGESDSDSVIVLMHHNPIPNNSIELRPYCQIMDGGKAMTLMMNTGKKIFILHGHTHYNYNIVASFPEKSGNFISSLGCGFLNGNPGAQSNISEFYFTDNNKHLITKAYTLFKSGTAGYDNRFISNVYEKTLTLNQSKINFDSILEKCTEINFTDLKLQTDSPQDNDLLKVLLMNEGRLVKIDKKSSDDYNNWIISKVIN